MQKRILSLLMAILYLSSGAIAQTMTLKPGPAAGQDVIIVTTHNCTPTNWPGPGEGLNFDGSQLQISAWTIYAGGCAEFEVRSLIRFDELSKICRNAKITRAELRLFGVPNSAQAPQGNSHYPGSPYLAWGPNNDGSVERVTNPWIENVVTWNTQPPTTPINAAFIPTSTQQWNENYTINVTGMVQDMVNLSNFNGFMLRLNNEVLYKNILWASSDDVDQTLWPELYVEYTCCDPGFRFCSSTDYPNTWNFSADDPTQPYIYRWNFGDGNIGFGPNATHTYMLPGSYKVCLQLIDPQTQKVSCERCIEICIREIVQPPHDDDDPDHPDNPQSKQSPADDAMPTTKGKLTQGDGTIVVTGINPNPAHSNIDVNLRLVKAGNVDYKVYSIDGRELVSGKQQMEKGVQRMSLSVEKLPAGMYILEVKDSYSQATYKFSKE